MSIQDIYSASLLAHAVYANNLPNGATSTQFKDRLIDDNPNLDRVGVADGTTQSQAEYIAENYRVINQVPTTSSGFSGTLFQDVNTNKYYLSFRGTDGSVSDPDWGDANLDNIMSGISRNQVVDMVNFYLQLTQTGIVNQYQYDELIIDVNSPPPSQPYVALGDEPAGQGITNRRYAVLLQSGSTEGLGLITDSTSLTVTGHSLGGHLASAFALLFSSVAQDTYTFNSAGFIGWHSDQFVKLGQLLSICVSEINIFPVVSRVTPITDITAPLDVVSHIGDHIGSAVEVSVESVDFLSVIENHSMDRLVDSLAVINFLSTLDETITLEKANTIVEAASNEMISSLEKLMNGFARLFNQPDIILTNHNDSVYTLIKNLTTALDGAGFTLESMVDNNGLAQLAGSDTEAERGYRYALVNLLPFAITSNLADTAAAGTEYDLVNFTPAYLSARSMFLNLLIARNTQDIPLGNSTYPDLADAIFYDESGEVQTTGSVTPLNYANNTTASRYIFGDNTESDFSGGNSNDYLFGMGDNDTLSGAAGNDYLEGGSGNDQLTGGVGNDTLYGGADDDTFLFTTADGFDKIIDTDHTGDVIKINNIDISGYDFKPVSANSNNLYTLELAVTI